MDYNKEFTAQLYVSDLTTEQIIIQLEEYGIDPNEYEGEELSNRLIQELVR